MRVEPLSTYLESWKAPTSAVSLLHVGGDVRDRQRGLRRYFPVDPPARVFVTVPAWPGNVDNEIDCVATI